MAQTPEQYQKLIDTLETLEVVPKADNILDFEAWMKSYLESKGEKVIKTEPKEKGPTETEKSRKYIIQPPRFSIFTGNDKKGSETTFDLWLYEVKCAMQDKTHSEEDITQASRRGWKSNNEFRTRCELEKDFIKTYQCIWGYTRKRINSPRILWN